MGELFQLMIDIKKEHFHVVKKLWKREYANNNNGVGVSLLHCACMHDGTGTIVRFFLKKGLDIEGVDERGLRAIHIAASSGRIETMTALIEAKCSLEVFTKDGETPLDFAVKNNKHDCVKLLRTAMGDEKVLLIHSLSMLINHETGETLLDLLLFMKNENTVEAIRSKPIYKKEVEDWISFKSELVNPQSYLLVQECLLYRCIRHNYHGGFVTLCTPEVVNRRGLFMEPSALETAVDFESDLFVALILRKLIGVDESWNRAAAMARDKRLDNISLMLSDRSSYLKEMNERGYGQLHIAVYDNDTNMVRYILENKLCDPDEGDKTVGTALSLAYSQGYMRCVNILQDYKVNVNTVDRLRQSPLHVAIMNRREDGCEYLVDNMRDIEAEDHMGLSVLALSVMRDCRFICERIVDRTKGSHKYVKIPSHILDLDPELSIVLPHPPHMTITGHETIHSLCIKVNRTIYPCLLDTIDKESIDSSDGHKDSLLHLFAVALLPYSCQRLVLRSANIKCVNDSGDTPLLALLKQCYDGYKKEGAGTCARVEKEYGEGGEGDLKKSVEIETTLLETVFVLIDGGSSINVEDSERCNILQKATEYQNEKLLLALISKGEHITLLKQADWLAWFDRRYFTFLKKVIPLTKIMLLEEWINVDLIKGISTIDDISLIKTLYDFAVNDVKTRVVETILHVAATHDDVDLFKKMVEKDVSSNSCLPGGDSLLHCLIVENKMEYCNLLLQSRHREYFIGRKNMRNKLPLHVCIETEYWDIIDALIWETKAVDEEDDEGNTPLSLLLGKISETVEINIAERLKGYIKTRISRSGDIYKVNKFQRTVISYCTNDNLRLLFETFQKTKTIPRRDTTEAKMSYQTHVKECSICHDEPINCTLTCGHTFCMTCAEKTVHCYVCRGEITERIFL